MTELDKARQRRLVKLAGPFPVTLAPGQVAHVIPEIVTYNEQDEIEGFEYDRLGPLLIAAFQERQTTYGQRLSELNAELSAINHESRRVYAQLSEENHALESKLDLRSLQIEQLHSLTERNAKLEARLTALEALLTEDQQLAGMP